MLIALVIHGAHCVMIISMVISVIFIDLRDLSRGIAMHGGIHSGKAVSSQ